MLNKYFLAGRKAKELMNSDNSMNPYYEGTREHLLWKIGNQRAVYTESIHEEFEEERNAEIILGDD